MKIFTLYHKEETTETYPVACDKIWKYINTVGDVNFARASLEGLWRDFSDEKYAAGFMEPDAETLHEFALWLDKRYM